MTKPREKKCYTFKCPRYPKCKVAAGNCCAVEWEDIAAIEEEECYLKGDYPLFVPKD